MNTLLVFIRNPHLGRVKTRLAQTLGPEEALRIYKFLLEKTRRAALEVAARRLLFYSEYIPEQDEWPENAFEKRLQHPGDLGARMEQGFQHAFESGAGKAVIIGSDCPELDGALLQRAFDVLDEHDFVLGPAHDGGYYLLGMKRLEPAVFQDMSWSTDTVCAETLRRIAALGNTCGLLPVLTDVDTEAEWEAYRAQMLYFKMQ